MTQPEEPPTTQHPQPVYGWVCIVIAGYLFSVALNLLPGDDGEANAPDIVIAICGFVFLVGGAMLLLRRDSKLNDALASVMLVAFAILGIWVCLLAPDSGFSGGLPFLTREQNITLARFVFGAGSLISLLMAGWAIRRALR